MKLIFIVSLLIILLSCQAQTIPEGKSETIQQLFDDYFREIIALNPEIGSYLALNPDGSYPFDQSKLSDRSEEAYQYELEIVKEYRTWLDTYQNLTDDEQIEAEVFRTYLNLVIDKDPYHRLDYAINCNAGLHITLQTRMTEHHKIENKQDALDYISRLNQFQDAYDELSELLKYQVEEGIIPPKATIERTLDELDDMIYIDQNDNIFYQDFCDKIAEIKLSESEEEELKSQAAKAVNEVVIPNLQKFQKEVECINETADNKPGLWKIPHGDELYQYYLKFHTTTDLTPQEIHDLGLQEVARIQEEMLERFAELGFTEGDTFGEIEGDYWNSLQGSKHNFSYGEKGKQQALDHYLQILAETEKLLPDYFSRIPSIPVTVKRVPPHKEKFTGAHYQRAPLDRSEPAAFYANLGWTPKKPGMATLLYHETIPGHHLQIAYAMDFCNSKIYRTLTFFTAFIEGWALYAEKLAFEEGWHKDIYSEIGYLGSELHRAVRLVVDTGIHFKKWSRKKAYNYMVNNMGWGSYGEIDRYTLWAGQACAYKIGELKILELRDRAKKQLGENFDLKEFHEVVLQNGAIPLSLLEDTVDDWLKNK